MEERPRPLRLGVIGAGWFASRRHCPDVADHPEAELVALCRRDEKQLTQMARAFAVTDTYTDYAELIGSGTVDGVIICSPHHLHFEHARAALDAGLHVLLEKPITVDPEEGRRLVALAGKTGRALVVAQNPPYWSHCRYLRDRLRRGDLGEIEGVSINWVGNALGVLGLEPLPDSLPGVVKPTLFRGDAAQNGGGFLVDGGSHLLCELLWCTGLRVAEVSAHMDNPDWDLRVALALTLENGALGDPLQHRRQRHTRQAPPQSLLRLIRYRRHPGIPLRSDGGRGWPERARRRGGVAAAADAGGQPGRLRPGPWGTRAGRGDGGSHRRDPGRRLPRRPQRTQGHAVTIRRFAAADSSSCDHTPTSPIVNTR